LTTAVWRSLGWLPMVADRNAHAQVASCQQALQDAERRAAAAAADAIAAREARVAADSARLAADAARTAAAGEAERLRADLGKHRDEAAQQLQGYIAAHVVWCLGPGVREAKRLRVELGKLRGLSSSKGECWQARHVHVGPPGRLQGEARQARR
jgi:hypothetical protein